MLPVHRALLVLAPKIRDAVKQTHVYVGEHDMGG